MSFDQIVVLICGALWLLHALRLARASWRRNWRGLTIALVALLVTGGSYFLTPAVASATAAGVLGLFMLVPVLASRGASRALKWGRITQARALSYIAWLFRPLPALRRFRTAVEISWRLNRGDAVDLDEAVASLGELSALERAANRLAFTSWTDDFEQMARLLEDASLRRFALRAGMSAIVVMAVGETERPAAVAELYRTLSGSGVLARRSMDATWSMLLVAAYLGQLDVVREQVHQRELLVEVPPERVAWLLATAAQRAGSPAFAAERVEAALGGALFASGRRRLRLRLERPLEALSPSDVDDDVVRDLRSRLHARRALAALSFDLRRPAPFTLAMSLTLVASFLWQSSRASLDVGYRAFALVAPYARAADPYRLLSHAWLHVGWTHLGVNLIGLLLFGRFVERHFARLRFTVIYLAGALGGGLTYLLWESDVGRVVGASGAVMALFGATVSRVAWDPALRRSAQGRRWLFFLGGVALLQLVLDALWPQSSGAAHAGGVAAGLLLGAILSRRRVDR